jgi:hypothetical protein
MLRHNNYIPMVIGKEDSPSERIYQAAKNRDTNTIDEILLVSSIAWDSSAM